MENIGLEGVNKVISDLVDFVEINDYDFKLYSNYADEFSASFNRYYNDLDNQSKERIREDLSNDMPLTIAIFVAEVTCSAEFKWKQNYFKMKELVLNRINDVLNSSTCLKNTKTNDFSLYDINFQLAKISKLLKEDLQKGYYIYNYLICEDEVSFLDKQNLEKYLTETKINNNLFLSEINNRCTEIIRLWNEDLKNIPEKKLDKIFSYTNEETKHLFTTEYDFYPIYLKKDKWEFYKLPKGKQFFFENYKYNLYTLWDIAERCNLIRNWITVSYPEINTINENTQPTAKESQYPTDKLWFTVGLKLATGELQQIYKETGCNAAETARQLGNKSLRPYISESVNNTNIKDKNIFSRTKKNLDLIINYCNENNLTICDDFKNKLPNQHD